jgi:glycosyltransferase involved in cell wall biosynthesis
MDKRPVAVRPQPILFVDHAPAMGGAEHYLMMLLKHLDRTQFTLHLALTNPALAEKATALKVPIHYVHLPRLRDSAQAELEWMKGAWVLAQLARRLGAAVLVGNTIRSSFFCALAAQIVRCSFVWYMHDFWLSESHPRYRQLDQFQKRFLCATATRVIAISHAVFHHIPCRQKTVVIHNGLDLTSYTPQPQGNDFRRIWQIPENTGGQGAHQPRLEQQHMTGYLGLRWHISQSLTK